jgi:hypothetical protein
VKKWHSEKWLFNYRVAPPSGKGGGGNRGEGGKEGGGLPQHEEDVEYSVHGIHQHGAQGLGR